MLTQSNEPAHRMTAKGARQRMKRPLASANDIGPPEDADGSTPTLQARLTYELYSGNPRGGTDGADTGTVMLSSAQEDSAVEARVTCDLYGGNSSDDTDAEVTFSVVESNDATAATIDPPSGNPRGGTDGPASTRSVVVKVHIPRGAATPRLRAEAAGGTKVSRLVRSFDARPAEDGAAAPT